MGSSNSLGVLSKKQLEALYRSNVRQRTRSSLGVAISTGLTGSGLLYMAAPAGVAAYGLNKSVEARDQLEEIIRQHGFRARKRDKLSGLLAGSVEKLTLSFLLLGHDEIVYLGDHQDLDPRVVQAHADWLEAGGNGLVVNSEGEIKPDTGVIGDGNGAYNALGDAIKKDFGVTGGVPENMQQVEGNVLAGAAVAGIEYASNRVGHAGRIVRVEDEMPDAFEGKEGKKKREDLGV